MEMSPIQPRPRLREAGFGRGSGLVLAAAIGADTLEARLTALAPLRRALGRGEIVLVDDGTLRGADRVHLARHCANPEFLAPGAVRARGVPQSARWTVLLAALERRRAAYWLVVDEEPLPDGAADELARAIASNRSFAQLAADPPPKDLVPHLPALAAEGWPYLNAASSVVGFAAGGHGRPLAAAVLARLEAALGPERMCQPDMARIAANFVIARERDAVVLPPA